MELVINFIDFGKIRLELNRGRLLTDSLTFGFEANLDTVLIDAVDKILKRNRIEILSLKSIAIGGDVDENSSAYKIAVTFIEAYKTAKNKPK